VKWDGYKPIEYTASKLLKDKPVWADVENPLDIKCWNELDPKTKVDRRSHMGIYEVLDGVPRNPVYIFLYNDYLLMEFVLNIVHISLRLDELVLKVEVNWEDGVLIMQLIQL
jgi:hypothetical protein